MATVLKVFRSTRTTSPDRGAASGGNNSGGARTFETRRVFRPKSLVEDFRFQAGAGPYLPANYIMVGMQH
jgi:hypothetical protein